MAEQSEEVIGMVVKLAAESTDFQNQMATLNRQLKVLQSDYKVTASTSKEFEDSMDGLVAKSQYLNNAIKTQQSIIEAHSTRLEKSKSRLAELAEAQVQLKNKLDNAKSSYEDTVRLHGEESDEAQKLNNKLKELQSQYDKNNDKVNSLSRTIDNQTISYNNARSTLNTFENQLKDTENAMEQMGNASNDVNNDMNNLQGTGNPFSSFTGGIKDALGQTKVFGVSLGDIGGALTGAINPASLMTGAVAGITSALTNLVTQGIQKVLETLVDLGKQLISTGNDFYEQVSKLKALTGETGKAAQGLNDLAAKLGRDTVFSASEAADAMQYCALAGWKLNDMAAGMPGILDLAAASGEDLSLVCDIVTDDLTALGYRTEDAGRMADVFTATMANSNTTVGQLGEALVYAGTTAGSLGYSMEDVSLAIGLMANSGMKASVAGTALRRLFTEMPSGIHLAGDAIGELDIATVNADGTMRDLKSVLIDMRAAFENMTEAERAMNAEAVSGKVGMSGLQAIMNATKEDFNSLSDAINNSSGIAAEKAAIMIDNVNGQMKMLYSKFESIGLAIYAIIEPIMLSLTKYVNYFVVTINTIVGYVATAISTVISIISPITDIIIAILTTVQDIVIKFLDPIFQAINQKNSNILDSLRSLADTVVPIIKSIGDVITPIIVTMANTIAAIINVMCGNFDDAWENVKSIFEKGAKDTEKEAVNHNEAMAKIAEEGEDKTTSTVASGSLDKYMSVKEIYKEIEDETDEHYDALKLKAQSYEQDLSANEKAYAEWKQKKLKEYEDKYDKTHKSSTLNQLKRRQQAMAEYDSMLDKQIENDMDREDKRYANILSVNKEYIDKTVKAYEEAEAKKEKTIEESMKRQMSWIDKLADYIKKAVSGNKADASISLGMSLTGYETGTNYVPYSGSYLVGERGPEIVDLPRGSSVRNNREISSSLQTDMTETNNLLRTLGNKLDKLEVTYKNQPKAILRAQRT